MSRRPEGQDAALKRLGSNIRSARTALGLTQGELAGSDVTRNMLSRIENGAALPSLPTLCAIADRLGLPPGALLGDLGGYGVRHLTSQLRPLLAKRRYSEIISRADDYLSKSSEAGCDAELSDILIKALTARSHELFEAGKLTSAIELLDRADSIPDPPGFDVSDARKKALTCRLLIACAPGQSPGSGDLERMREAVFSDNARELYVLAHELLADAVGQAYSVPDKNAPEYRRILSPLIERMPEGFERRHIEAKLQMAEAEYLNAKALMVPLVSESLPPSLLYDLYSDIEHCCKCCGDFENAYKYASEKLVLLQRIK